MGGTTSKSDKLYKKIHLRSQQTPVKAIDSVQNGQNENSVTEVQLQQAIRAPRKSRRKERVSLSSNKDEDVSSIQGTASDGETSSVAGFASDGVGISLSSGRSTLGCYVESPELDDDELTKKVASLDLTDQGNLQRTESAAKRSSCKDFKETGLKNTEYLQYPTGDESPDLERDCDSKAVLAGSRLNFQSLSSSSDEEGEAPTGHPSGKGNALVDNWMDHKKKKGIKRLIKRKDKAEKRPVVKGPEGPRDDNWYLTEELDEDWLKDKDIETIQHSNINGHDVVKQNEYGYTRLDENLSGNENLETDISLKHEKIQIETAKKKKVPTATLR